MSDDFVPVKTPEPYRLSPKNVNKGMSDDFVPVKTPEPYRLSPKTEIVERDPKTISLLEALAQEDELFDYNVPPSIRSSWPEQKLADHIKAVYAQPAFVIENPDDIKKYVKVGDVVVWKEEYKEETGRLKKGAEGTVTKFKDDGKIIVQFDNQKTTWNFSKKESLTILGYTEGKKVRPLAPGASLEDIKIEIGHKVRYTDDDHIEYNGERIPAGAEGLVAAIYDDKYPLLILWRYQPDVTQKINPVGEGVSHLIEIKKRWSYDSVKLIRPNTVPFEKLLQKYVYGKEEP